MESQDVSMQIYLIENLKITVVNKKFYLPFTHTSMLEISVTVLHQ
jgi:hypothetical protein